MSKIKTPNEIIKDAYVGEVITGFEFGQNEPGTRSVTLPQKITDAFFYFDGEDAGVMLILENGESVFLYDNESMISNEQK